MPNSPQNTHPPFELVGLFCSPESLEAAISALGTAGWDRAEMSLVAQKHLLEPEAPLQENADTAADDPNVDRGAVMSDTDVRQGRNLATALGGVVAAFAASGAVIMTGGTALAALVGAAAAGGGAAAAVNALGQWAGEHRAAHMDDQMRQGGILLWVMLRDPGQEQLARDILTRHGAISVHTHRGEG